MWACVKNEKGELLSYSVKYCKSVVEDWAKAYYGDEYWTRLKSLGCKVVNIEVKEID